ncbi:hypothetical protein ERO13_A03G057550v2 [Gossypium hirsutum]|nr:hypothetical protein ERO13_A03G057550v2 [Gossypium hirsutum]
MFMVYKQINDLVVQKRYLLRLPTYRKRNLKPFSVTISEEFEEDPIEEGEMGQFKPMHIWDEREEVEEEEENKEDEWVESDIKSSEWKHDD